MPILGIDGTYIPRKPQKQPKRPKAKKRQTQPTATHKSPQKITQAQAAYIYDMKQAARLRDITRED